METMIVHRSCQHTGTKWWQRPNLMKGFAAHNHGLVGVTDNIIMGITISITITITIHNNTNNNKSNNNNNNNMYKNNNYSNSNRNTEYFAEEKTKGYICKYFF